MSYTFADGLLAESRVAEFNGENRTMSREVTAQQLFADAANFPNIHGAGFPFSGDHLGTHTHREEHYIPGVGWEQGDAIRRERIHTSNVNVWAMVAA